MNPTDERNKIFWQQIRQSEAANSLTLNTHQSNNQLSKKIKADTELEMRTPEEQAFYNEDNLIPHDKKQMIETARAQIAIIVKGFETGKKEINVDTVARLKINLDLLEGNLDDVLIQKAKTIYQDTLNKNQKIRKSLEIVQSYSNRLNYRTYIEYEDEEEKNT